MASAIDRLWPRAGFWGGLIGSLGGNVLAVHLGTQGELWRYTVALVWPLAVIVMTEVLGRTRWNRGVAHWLIRWVLGGLLLAVAGVISWEHLSFVIDAAGNGWFASHFGPLAIDGLMVMCAVAMRINDGQSSPSSPAAELNDGDDGRMTERPAAVIQQPAGDDEAMTEMTERPEAVIWPTVATPPTVIQQPAEMTGDDGPSYIDDPAGCQAIHPDALQQCVIGEPTHAGDHMLVGGWRWPNQDDTPTADEAEAFLRSMAPAAEPAPKPGPRQYQRMTAAERAEILAWICQQPAAERTVAAVMERTGRSESTAGRLLREAAKMSQD